MNTEHSPKHKQYTLILIIVLILNLLLLLYVSFFKRDSLRLETLKVGGSDNMKLVKQLYRTEGYQQQQQAAIQQVLDSMGVTTAQPDTTATATDTTTTLDSSKYAEVKKGAYIEGNPDARITILEYSELLCPYCKRQSDNKVMEQLLQKYPDDVNVIFKHYIVHPDAARLAEAAECVGEQLGTAKFYEFISKGFDLEDKTDAGVLSLAKDLGVKAKAFTECTTSDKYVSAIEASSNEGRTLFGVTGTPGNVIIDNEKGTFALIAGAYPIETFQTEIDKILGK